MYINRVSDPAGLEDSKGSFNYYAGYTSFLLKNIMPTCRFWGSLFKNEVCTPSSLHFRWKEAIPETDTPFSQIKSSFNLEGTDTPIFFFLVTRETEVFEGNWLGQDDILTSDYRCNLCAFCSTLKLLFCCTYTENLTFSSGSLPRLGTGGTWKYHAAFPYQGQPPWGSVKVYSRWNCPCKAHVFSGKRLLCSHYSASLYKGIHHSLSPSGNSPNKLRHLNTIASKTCCPQATSASSPAAIPLQKTGHKTIKISANYPATLALFMPGPGALFMLCLLPRAFSPSPQAIQVLLSLHHWEALLDLFKECLRHSLSLSMVLAILFSVSGLCDFFLQSGC